MTINPKKEYSLKQIIDERMIPWALHFQTLRKIISNDLKNKNILQAIWIGEKRGIRYRVMGDRIINYKKEYCKQLSKQ